MGKDAADTAGSKLHPPEGIELGRQGALQHLQPAQAGSQGPSGLRLGPRRQETGREESSGDPSLATGKKWCQTTVPVVSNTGGQELVKGSSSPGKRSRELGNVAEADM